MRDHSAGLDRIVMDPAPALYTIRIDGHLGPLMLSAFPAMESRWQGTHTVLTGLLDHSSLHGALSVIEDLGLDLLEVRKHVGGQPQSPGLGDDRSLSW